MDRPELDLGALLGRLAAELARREQPVLAAHGLSMWEYVVLVALLDRVPQTQTELSREARRDPTRLLAHLDDLERRSLVHRTVDATDRRRHRVSLTPAGVALVRSCREEIRALEEVLLRPLPADRAAALRADLAALLGSGNP